MFFLYFAAFKGCNVIGHDRADVSVRTHLIDVVSQLLCYNILRCQQMQGGWMVRRREGDKFHFLSILFMINKQPVPKTFSAQFLLRSHLWRICMSFLLIRNDFGFIVPFTVSSAHLVLLFQCLINGHGQNPKVQRRLFEEHARGGSADERWHIKMWFFLLLLSSGLLTLAPTARCISGCHLPLGAGGLHRPGRTLYFAHSGLIGMVLVFASKSFLLLLLFWLFMTHFSDKLATLDRNLSQSCLRQHCSYRL